MEGKNSEENKPKVGVGIGVMIFKNGRVLLGKRKGSHGAGEWAPPGGHFEYGESLEESARREVREETGLEIESINFLSLYNQKDYMPKHVINIGLTAKWKSGEAKVLEPEKCEEWKWCEIDNLPEPLFATVKNYVVAIKTGKNYFDS